MCYIPTIVTRKTTRIDTVATCPTANSVPGFPFELTRGIAEVVVVVVVSEESNDTSVGTELAEEADSPPRPSSVLAEL